MRKYFLIMLFALVYSNTFSQWNNNTTVNNLVATNALYGDQYPIAITDKSNGSIIIYMGANFAIHAQKITSNGIIAWGGVFNPVMICNGYAVTDNTMKGISDGIGGAYIAWEDSRTNSNSEIYIQHINSNGTISWVANGIKVTNNNNINAVTRPTICLDKNNGLIVSWTLFSDTNAQVFAQRYNISGSPLWQPGGIQLCTATGFRYGGLPVADGTSGATFLFMDSRDDIHGTEYEYFPDRLANLNIYAQRLDSNGNRLWTDNGASVCLAPGNQLYEGYALTVSDGNGGTIFVFDDERHISNPYGIPSDANIYAQKLNSSGVTQWNLSGIPITTAPGNQVLDAIVTDGSGGMVVVWTSAANVMSQKINSVGNSQWLTNGIVVGSGVGGQVIADSVGNYIYSYKRATPSPSMVKSQKINSTGVLQWDVNGIIVSNNPTKNPVRYNPLVLSDSGSAIIVWESPPNTYASKILSTGLIASSLSNSFVSIADGNWNNPAIWSGGVIPPETAQVVLRHVVTITANATCKFLTVEQPNGNVRVKTGVVFIITN